MGSCRALPLVLRLGLAFAVGGCAPGQPPAPPTTASPSEPVREVAQPASESCRKHWTPVDHSLALQCTDHWLAQNDAQAAFHSYDRLVRRRRFEQGIAYDFAETAAMYGRSDATASTLAALDTMLPARLIMEGVLALHRFQRTGEPAEAEAVRRSFQALLARQPRDLYALALALRLHLHVGARDSLTLGLAWQICQERLSWLETGDMDAPGRAEVLARCAEVAFASDRPREGRGLFARARELDPRRDATRLRWAELELAAGNLFVASELFAAATAASRAYDRLAAQLGLGVTRARMRDGAGAEQAYRDAIAAYDQWIAPPTGARPALPREILYNLGVVLAASGEQRLRAEARQLLQAFLEREDIDEIRGLRCRQLLLELAGEFP